MVLAATSRPDLLDAALLRPGRLDRLIYCGMPTQPERLAILKALSKGLKLSDSINLDALATLCEGYTGADLGALLSDAQMEAVHLLLDKKQPQTQKKVNFSTVVIIHDHPPYILMKTNVCKLKEKKYDQTQTAPKYCTVLRLYAISSLESVERINKCSVMIRESKIRNSVCTPDLEHRSP